jgi:hypothetical protein
MNPAAKRFQRAYLPVADAIAMLDVTQREREVVADAVADGFVAAREGGRNHRDYDDHLFRHYAKDPLGPCAGPGDEAYSQPCPEGRTMRTHKAILGPDDRRPAMRCASCGAAVFVPGYRERTGRGVAA